MEYLVHLTPIDELAYAIKFSFIKITIIEIYGSIMDKGNLFVLQINELDNS